MEKLQRSFYFPGMQRKVAKYINRCDSCARNKNTYQRPPGKMTVNDPTPTRPWQRITADFVEMPIITDTVQKRKLDEILVVVDSFSKFTILIPTTKTATTEEIFQLMWERVFAIFGIPERMVSDRDKIFKTERWRRLMEEVKTTVELSTAHHQQSDGQTERKIQELRAYLRHYLDYEQANWNKLTPIAQYALNDAKSATTGETPNYLVFGTERSMGQDKRCTEPGTSHAQQMEIIHAQVKLDIEWQEAIMKRYYDSKRSNTPTFRKGDRVYLRRRTMGETRYNIKTKRPSQKLDSVRIGPYEIEAKLERDNYRLKLPERMRIHPIFHVSLLTKTKNAANNRDEILEEYEVDEILDKRVRNGVTEYLVRWDGYEMEESTWEPTQNLNCPDVVRRFEDRMKTARRN